MTSSGSKNPITNDVKLNIMVHDKLDTVSSYKQFQRWKSKFLNRFDTYLTQSGMAPADAASEDLMAHLDTCLRRASLVLKRLDAGDLSPVSQKRTVKSSQALKEFEMSLEECRVDLRELVPAKHIDEKRKRYTKFHVGASLIRAGFPQYVAMTMLEDTVNEISERTYDPETGYDNLNKQERELFQSYKNQVTQFCDIMADLDLYEIMLKCVEFLNPLDGEEDDDVEELTIFVKRYQRYHQGEIIKASSSNGTDPTDSDSDNEPSFRGDEDEYGNILAQPITVKIDVEDCETIANVATMVAEDLGFQLKPLDAIDITNQLTIRYSNDKVVEAPKTTTLKQLRIEQGDVLTIEQALVPIRVRRILPNGELVELTVLIDPLASLRELKFGLEHQQHQSGDGVGSIPAEDQRLFLQGAELSDDDRSCSGYGIVSGSVLDLEAKTVDIEEVIQGEEDSIVIVDTKYGTMFSVDREMAIAKGVLTPKIVNTDDVFLEATQKDADKNQMLKAMMSSPNLKVKAQLVIAKMKIEDYELEQDTANEVKNMWGVQLKNTRQNQRVTELFFVDLKTEAVGFLDRRKLVEKKFITVVKATNFTRDNKEQEWTLEQAEKDPVKYDFFVFEIRKIFGIAAGFEESFSC
jgi:hypothetical protein